MMASSKNEPIIEVKNLSKQYSIGADKTYKTLCDSFTSVFKNPLKALRDSRKPNNTFWALKDVNFRVEKGEVVGIIGRNGAGKSTLLKVLSRITQPTDGEVIMRGRVGSLLEVGTGFHPELTGRENIYFNGSILGMKKKEIDQKFDEIVKFSGVEKFLDTPVKRFSSGMQVRLAFSVAANLDPEILVVDEVLAVGDSAFQKKCLGKIEEISGEGRTVLFVSHNMGIINSLCSRAILLSKGINTCDGIPNEVISEYINDGNVNHDSHIFFRNDDDKKTEFDNILKEVELFSEDKPTSIIKMGGDLKIAVRFSTENKIENIRFGISIEDNYGQRILNFSPSHQDPSLLKGAHTNGTIICYIPYLPLICGTYFISLIIASGSDDLERIDQAAQIHIEEYDVFNTGQIPQKQHGTFYLKSEWKFNNE